MDLLLLKDFRCFSGALEIPLRPITLLVGENSSGKTSLLAAARIAEQLRNPMYLPDFNEEPFSLGSYDEIANYQTPRPQGEHVPILLAQLYGHEQWEHIRGPLEKFARASGLFDEIAVKKLGKSESSPFQVLVKLGGPPRNLIEVGYGVSQVLPVIVDLLRDRNRRMFLIQQPEVHLHPRAQAELGSLFVRIAKAHSKQLLVETHSDYIIGRARMEVRSGTIAPEDVNVLYFERSRTKISLLSRICGRVSAQAVPQGYAAKRVSPHGRFGNRTTFSLPVSPCC